mmetsp:Transcript_10015/g.34047  ORF Transcript_10015/g.34047 Transcript_10015/m.34047 type:complete len:271 (+) Transcript_10015:74-886(+)
MPGSCSPSTASHSAANGRTPPRLGTQASTPRKQTPRSTPRPKPPPSSALRSSPSPSRRPRATLCHRRRPTATFSTPSRAPGPPVPWRSRGDAPRVASSSTPCAWARTTPRRGRWPSLRGRPRPRGPRASTWRWRRRWRPRPPRSLRASRTMARRRPWTSASSTFATSRTPSSSTLPAPPSPRWGRWRRRATGAPWTRTPGRTRTRCLCPRWCGTRPWARARRSCRGCGLRSTRRRKRGALRWGGSAMGGVPAEWRATAQRKSARRPWRCL